MGKIRFQITNDGLIFSKGKGKLKEPIRKTIFCGTCGKTHPITKDGFEWMDCELEHRRTKPIND